MTWYGRIDKLERALQPEEVRHRLRMCTAPEGLSQDDHDRWHAARGEECFTLMLGECDVSSGT